MSKDTYFRVYDQETCFDIEEETIDGTGVSDALKASNLNSVRICNKTFVGSPSENDIDLCRGVNAIIGPNNHYSKPGVSNITIKGGFDSVIIYGNFGTLEWGQFSIYDKWFKLPKSKNLYFSDDAVGTVIIWYAELPENLPSGVKIKKINPIIVYGYFFWRSLCLTLQDLSSRIKK